MTDRDPYEHDVVARRLEAERPIPGAAFRGDLRRHLVARTPPARPARLRLLVAGQLAGGLLLLAVAAVGAVGNGPLGG